MALRQSRSRALMNEMEYNLQIVDCLFEGEKFISNSGEPIIGCQS